MPVALRWATSAAVGPNARRSRRCRICRSEARSAGTADPENPKQHSNNTVIPAKAGIHLPETRAAEQWVPAFAGTTDLGSCVAIRRTRGMRSFFTRPPALSIPALTSFGPLTAEIWAALFEESCRAL